MTKETSFEFEIQPAIQAVAAHFISAGIKIFSAKVSVSKQFVRSEHEKALMPVVFVQYLNCD